MLQEKTKVFCLGLPKTGTTSLNKALAILGYEMCPYDIEWINQVSRNNYTAKDIVAKTNNYNGFEDWPWPILADKLFEIHPKSIYILTVRKDSEIWFDSLRKHTQRSDSENSKRLRNIFYGYSDVINDRRNFIEFYENFNKKVISTAEKTGISLHVMCFENGDSWERLSEILNLNIDPNILSKPFPKSNSREEHTKAKKFLRKCTNFLKKLLSA